VESRGRRKEMVKKVIIEEMKEIYLLHRRVFATLLWDLPRLIKNLGRRRRA
jgi:hypothetical protein